MSAQLFINAMVIAFAEEVNVEVGDAAGFKGVGIINHLVAIALSIFNLIICEFFSFNQVFEEVRLVATLHWIILTVLRQNHPSSFSIREVHTYGPDGFPILLNHVGSQHLEGIVMLIPNDAIDLLGGNRYSHR